MAYTAPTTRITGDVITSGHWNTDITSNIAWLATDKPMCRAKNSTYQTINNNADTALTFDAEDFDNATLHSTSSNTSRITFATAGRYLIGGASFVTDTTGSFQSRISVRADGSTFVVRSSHANIDASGQCAAPCVTTVYTFAANAYAELVGWHQRGLSMPWGEDGTANNDPSNFWAVWLSTS